MNIEGLGAINLIPPVKVIVKKNGVFIRFSTNKPFDIQKTDRALTQRGIKEYNKDALQMAFENPDEKWHQIADYPVISSSKESSLTININNAKTIATVIMSIPFGGARTLDYEEVLEKMKEAGITNGILFENIKELVNEELINTTIMVAHVEDVGVKLNDNNIILHFLNKVRTQKDNESQVLDYHSFTDSVQHVEKGELLAEIIPPKQIEWKNILGETVISTIDPKNAKTLKAGKNVTTPDGIQFFAAEGGHVFLDNNTLTITTVFTVEGDVDYSVGNIDFFGDIHIKGNVKPGFTIKSNGHILINGFVEDSKIIAKGNIIVKLGTNGGYLNSESNVIGNFMDNTEIHAKGNLYIKQELMNCCVFSRGMVVVFAGKGGIIGGEIAAKSMILAKKVGSESHTKTKLVVGKDPELEKAKNLLIERADILQKDVKKLETMLIKMSTLKGNEVKQKEIEAKIQRALFIYTEKYNFIQRELERLASYISANTASGFISVKNTLYPGVFLSVNDSQLELKEEIISRNFIYKNGSIHIEPYVPNKVERELEDIIAGHMSHFTVKNEKGKEK